MQRYRFSLVEASGRVKRLIHPIVFPKIFSVWIETDVQYMLQIRFAFKLPSHLSLSIKKDAFSFGCLFLLEEVDVVHTDIKQIIGFH